MATDVHFYDQHANIVHKGLIPYEDGNARCALVTSAYTPLGTHTIWADVSANEVASGSGYTTGGVALANVAVSNTEIDFDDPAWTALTKTFRYAVFYYLGTVGGLVNPLLAYMELNDAPADEVINGQNYSIVLPAGGFMTFTLTDAT